LSISRAYFTRLNTAWIVEWGLVSSVLTGRDASCCSEAEANPFAANVPVVQGGEKS
jgi:hypothetical protein